MTTRVQRPFLVAALDEARLAEPLDDRREVFGGDGQVIEPVPLRAVGRVDLVELGLEPRVGCVVVERAACEEDPGGELGPDVGEAVADGLLQRRLDLLAERLVVPVAAGVADDRRLGRQVPGAGEVVKRRHQLAVGQVARRAEEDDGARVGRLGAWQSFAQRVGVGRRLGHRRGLPSRAARPRGSGRTKGRARDARGSRGRARQADSSSPARWVSATRRRPGSRSSSASSATA